MNTRESFTSNQIDRFQERLTNIADRADSLLDCVYQLATSLKSPREIPRFIGMLTLISSLINPGSAYAQTDQSLSTNFDTQTVTTATSASGIAIGENKDTGEHSIEYYQNGIQVESNDSVPMTTSEVDRLEGSQPWISLLCTYPTKPVFFEPVSYFEDLNRQLNDYWQEVSYGAINQGGSEVAGPYILDHDASYYELTDRLKIFQLIEDCIAKADSDTDFSKFTGINIYFQSSWKQAYSAFYFTTLDGEEKQWLATVLPDFGHNLDVTAHEQGHGYGMDHSAGTSGKTYTNPYDNMSKSDGQHPTGIDKVREGWIVPTVISEGEIQTVELTPLSADHASVVMVSSAQQPVNSYTIEARDNTLGYDRNLSAPSGVVVTQVRYERQYIVNWKFYDGVKLMTGRALGRGGSWTSPEENFVSVCVDGKKGENYVVTVANGVELDCSEYLLGTEVFLPKISSIYPAESGK